MTLAHYGEAGGPCEAKQYAKNDDSSGYTRNCVCK